MSPKFDSFKIYQMFTSTSKSPRRSWRPARPKLPSLLNGFGSIGALKGSIISYGSNFQPSPPSRDRNGFGNSTTSPPPLTLGPRGRATRGPASRVGKGANPRRCSTVAVQCRGFACLSRLAAACGCEAPRPGLAWSDGLHRSGTGAQLDLTSG